MTTDLNLSEQGYKALRSWEFKQSPLSTEQKREARAFLIGYFRQTKCFLTGKPIVRQMLHDAYDLHHRLPRGSPGYNFLPNMALALHGPNANAGKPKAPAGYRERDRNIIPPSATDLLRETVPYDQGSAEMKANAQAEVEYRGWMWEKLLSQNRMTKDSAIWAGAEKVGVSGQATRDYLKKLTSAEGPFHEAKPVNGVKWITIKPGRLT